MQRTLFEYHPTYGYRFIPGLRARLDNDEAGYLVRVNEAGFRSEREFTEKKPPGVRRILLFGDSFTAGDAVSNRDRYGDRIEKLLPDVEVYNFGLPGSGTDQQYLIFHDVARQYEHDLVVLGLLVENIRRVAARYRRAASATGEQHVMAKPYFCLGADGELTLHHHPVPKEPVSEDSLPLEEREHVDRGGQFAWLRGAVNALGGTLKDHVQRFTRYQPLPAYDSGSNPDWRLLRAIVERWAAEARVPLLVCPIPLYQYVEETASPDGYQARFGELSNVANLRLHDPLADFQRAPREERRCYRFAKDVHLTAEGHRVLAESLARGINAVLPRPEA